MLTLVRFAYAPFGTYGRLMVPDCDTVFWTVGPPWLANMPEKSCIPEGTYGVVKDLFVKDAGSEGYDAFRICGVPGRSRIFIHIANWPRQLKGCIGIGLRVQGDSADSCWGVADSQVAHDLFMQAMGATIANHIKVTSCFHGS